MTDIRFEYRYKANDMQLQPEVQKYTISQKWLQES